MILCSLLTVDLMQTPNPFLRPGVSVAAALHHLFLRRSFAAGTAMAPVSPHRLCLSSLCYGALCWRPSFCIGTRSPLLLIETGPLPCATVPTDSISSGGLAFQLMTSTLPSQAVVCAESGRCTQARMDSTVASDPPGWCP